ncbi:MAG: hypothetical protein M0Z94_08545 [Dehalococcoidales bacterium]|nr:hypothetical protein [Dehalococcoidales bacterium]
MDIEVIDGMPLSLSMEGLLRQLHVREDSPQAEELQGLVREAETIGRPKALYGMAYIDERGDDYVVIDGVRFTSRVLAVNLGQSHRVFPFLATCGTELEAWAKGLTDLLQQYWSEAIREMALRQVREAMFAHLDETYHPGETSRMAPGSLADWPIEQQTQLFQLLGDTEKSVGVRLTSSQLMIPSKTVSGIRFSKTWDFESCMLCPRVGCPNRRAAYDPALYNERYKKSVV